MSGVNIMGGGLSGLTAAINLAQAGYTVDVFENRSDCGKRFLGDVEGLENWSSPKDIVSEIQQMGININFDCHPFNQISLSDGNEVVDVSSDTPFFYLVKRGPNEGSLDYGLKQQALDVGVNLHFNAKVNKDDMDIISIGSAENNPVGIVSGVRFETTADDIAVCLLNREASNRGYSYLLITQGYGCICSVNFYGGDKKASSYFEKTFDIMTDLFDFDITNKKRVGGVGSFLLKPRLTQEGRLYTGEAAGLQDLLSGFGMRYAFKSGFLAAKSIIDDEKYTTLVRQSGMLGRLKASLVNRFFVERMGDQYAAYSLRQAKNNEDSWMEVSYKAYNPSVFTHMVYPIAKWYLSWKLG